jgi:hypothetical protein
LSAPFGLDRAQVRAVHTKGKSFFFADIKEDRTIRGKRKPILRCAQMIRF